MIDLRLGRWQEALEDVEMCDAVICDPPYSERTHKGQRSAGVGPSKRNRRPDTSSVALDLGGCSLPAHHDEMHGSRVKYGSASKADIEEAIRFWAPRVRRWFVVFGDHLSAEQWRVALDKSGFYAFHPIVWTKTDAAPRMHCDGPSSQHETITIARPRRRLGRAEMRYRPGWYCGPSANKGIAEDEFHIIGQKPIWLMTTLVAAYSEPGDLVVDPFCGSGTTAIACHRLGRSCITSEMDPATHAMAKARIDRELAQLGLFEGATP
jgi:site-specific DNA-methyltransferase (adenine-specific)